MVPLELRGEKNIKARALDLLDKVGLSDRGHHYPAQLSGGEQQRVSLARAFSNAPRILFADEPTGNLHSDQGRQIMEIFRKLNDEGITIIQVTHSEENARFGKRIIKVADGAIVADEKVTENTNV